MLCFLHSVQLSALDQTAASFLRGMAQACHTFHDRKDPRLDAMRTSGTKCTKILHGTMWQVLCAIVSSNVTTSQVCRRQCLGLTTNFSADTTRHNLFHNRQQQQHFNITHPTDIPFFFSFFTCGTVGLSSSRHLLFPGVPRHVVVVLLGPRFGHFSSLVQPDKCRSLFSLWSRPAFNTRKWSRLTTQRVAAT